MREETFGRTSSEVANLVFLAVGRLRVSAKYNNSGGNLGILVCISREITSVFIAKTWRHSAVSFELQMIDVFMAAGVRSLLHSGGAPTRISMSPSPSR